MSFLGGSKIHGPGDNKVIPYRLEQISRGVGDHRRTDVMQVGSSQSFVLEPCSYLQESTGGA